MPTAKFSSGATLPGAHHGQPGGSHISGGIGSSPRTDSRRPPAVSGRAVPPNQTTPLQRHRANKPGVARVVLEPPKRTPSSAREGLPRTTSQGKSNQIMAWNRVCLQTFPCHICCFELGPEYSSPKCIIYTYSRQFII